MSDETVPQEQTQRERLIELLSELRETEDQIAPHKKRMEEIREEVSTIVAHTGKVNLPGLAEVYITSASVSFKYNTGKMDNLVHELLETNPDLAQRISALREVSQRSGSLTIKGSKKP